MSDSSAPSAPPGSPAPPASPLAQHGPWDLVAEGYDDVTRAYLAQFSEEALPHLRLTAESQLLDVACGPGTTTLLAAPRVRQVTSLDFSQNMLSHLEHHLKEDSVDNVTVVHGDGQALPFADDGFDAAISMFGLMFFPDRVRGMREIHRVLVSGGRVVIASWAPAAQSPLMAAMFDAVRAIDPDRPESPSELESLENPSVFQTELERAGFSKIEIVPATRSMTVESPEAFWNEMVRGSVPLVMLKRSMTAEQWAVAEQRALERLRSQLKPNSSLASTAYFGIATKS